MKIGYVRVSTAEQNTARQEVIMEALEVDSVYIDRVSGKDARRPELQKMLSYLRPGDTVVVESISRFARNTKDLLELMETLEAKGAAFISQKEAIDTTTPSGKFMLTVFGAMAELERDYIRLRQKEGIAIAKKEGKYKGRKPISVDNEKFQEVCNQWQSGQITAKTAMNELNLKPNTFYRRVKETAI